MTYKEDAPISALASHVERFVQERRYLRGVSPATEAWYKFSFRAFAPVLAEPYQSTMAFKTAVMGRIGALMAEKRGNKAVSVNTYLRCLKAFLNWCHQEGIIGQPVKLSWLKEEQKVLATLSAEQVRRIVAYRPASTAANRYGNAVTSEQRLHTLICLLLDTGLRLSEALNLETGNVDLENLILKVRGKGGKERLVPFSFEMRKHLFRFISRLREPSCQSPYVFQTRNGTKLRSRDVLRSFKKLGKRLGIVGVRFSPHTCRHSFAVGYLRNGGNLFYLAKALGHSTIKTTELYLQSVGVEDLKAVHNRLSLLARA